MPLTLFGPKKIFDAQSVSGALSYRSLAIDMLCMDFGSLEVQWTGNPRGVLSIEGSNGGVFWYPTGTEIYPPTGSGSSDNTLVPLERVDFRYLSLLYTNTGGSGELTVIAIAKGIGA